MKPTRQFIVHSKSCRSIGVEEALKPTPPKGKGWELRSQWSHGNYVFFAWERSSAQALPTNEFPW